MLRLLSFHKPEYGLFSPELPALLEQRVPKFLQWAKAVVAQESVNFIWDEAKVGKRTAAKFKPKN